MLKLNVGHSRKVGEPNFGSRGASVNLEMEVESDLISRPDEMKARIRRLFQLAKESVAEELNGGNVSDEGSNSTTNGNQSNGSRSYGNGHTPSPRQATPSQLRAVRAIAGKHRLDLPGILQQRFNVHSENELSIATASQLIDLLKAEAGEVTR